MSAILSFVRKDLRLLRWPWLGWMGLFAAKLGLAAWVLTASEFTSDDNTLALRLNIALTGLTMLAGAVLVAWLVQADAPRRAQVFWRTRPISGVQLLVAKALTAAMLFYVGPVLLALPWWLFNGVPAADVAWSALEMLLVHGAAFTPVFLIAALVDTTGRAVLWSLVQYGAVICLPIMGEFFSDNLIDLERGLAESRVLVAAVLVLLGLPWLIVWQYTRRVTVAAVAWLVLMQAVAVMAWLFSPYNLLLGPGAWTELKSELARGVTLQPATAASLYEAKRYGQGPELVYVRTYWPMTGVPEGLIADADIINADLAPAGGETEPAKNAYAWSFRDRRIRTMLGVNVSGEDFLPPSLPKLSTPVYVGFAVAVEEANKLIAHPPAVDVALRVALWRPEIVFNQPLNAGDWHVDTNCGLRLVRVESEYNSVRVNFASTRADNLFSLIGRYYAKGQGRGNAFSDFDRSHSYFLVQPENGIVSSLQMGKSDLRILGVWLRRVTISEAPRTSRRNGKQVPFSGDLAAWRAGLRIALVAQHEEARFFLKGRTEALVIEDGRPKKKAVAGQSGSETSTSAP